MLNFFVPKQSMSVTLFKHRVRNGWQTITHGVHGIKRQIKPALEWTAWTRERIKPQVDWLGQFSFGKWCDGPIDKWKPTCQSNQQHCQRLFGGDRCNMCHNGDDEVNHLEKPLCATNQWPFGHWHLPWSPHKNFKLKKNSLNKCWQQTEQKACCNTWKWHCPCRNWKMKLK